jgi:hypothetical protein
VPLHVVLPLASHPAKVDPLLGSAVQAPIEVPEEYDPEEQSVPETVPLPVPFVLTVNVQQLPPLVPTKVIMLCAGSV